MLCYKDRTFCSVKCAELRCTRNLTEDVIRDAEAWWGSEEAPITTSDLSSTCGMYKPITGTIREFSEEEKQASKERDKANECT